MLHDTICVYTVHDTARRLNVQVPCWCCESFPSRRTWPYGIGFFLLYCIHTLKRTRGVTQYFTEAWAWLRMDHVEMTRDRVFTRPPSALSERIAFLLRGSRECYQDASSVCEKIRNSKVSLIIHTAASLVTTHDVIPVGQPASQPAARVYSYVVYICICIIRNYV